MPHSPAAERSFTAGRDKRGMGFLDTKTSGATFARTVKLNLYTFGFP